jgi:hypothetical protein
MINVNVRCILLVICTYECLFASELAHEVDGKRTMDELRAIAVADSHF